MQARLIARGFVAVQYLLPRHLLTAFVYRISRIRIAFIKNALIRSFAGLFHVDLSETPRKAPGDFRDFNDFFTRELDPGARPICERADAIVSPADGTVSRAGTLHADRIVQAKGIDYTLDDLFAIDIDDVRAYANGSFVTIYLAPHNYHRVHMPLDGCLRAAHYVPGDLFSVNDASVAVLRGLFRRNERLVLHFDTARGPMALIFVGALNVGSITTPWTGEIRPRKRGVVEPQDLGTTSRVLRRGDLLGWFNMGSTVILLLPEGRGEWQGRLAPGAALRMGEMIGALTDRPR